MDTKMVDFPCQPLLKRLYHKKKIITCSFSVYFQDTVAQITHKNINHGIIENISKDKGKGPFGSISPIDVYMANGFFLYSLEYSQRFPG
jgi:hypothetical protein